MRAMARPCRCCCSHRHVGNRAAGQDKARASEYPRLATVAYTAFLSPLLIAQPLVKEGNVDQSAASAPQFR
jgi:hypothetical protein